YCQSTWVSEWGWNKVTPWIAEISSWELENASGPGKQPLLFGFVSSEQTRWWIAEDYWDANAARGLEAVHVRRGDGTTITVDARRVTVDHSDEYMIVAPLPEGFEQGELSWTDAQRVRRTIDRAQLAAGTQLVPL
ncbi:MAG TPA: hypothetical protein VM869_15670, partial [Enhygromyxa sp.]|nr:hypothetical protein [Enhygromyxa sp.]